MRKRASLLGLNIKLALVESGLSYKEGVLIVHKESMSSEVERADLSIGMSGMGLIELKMSMKASVAKGKANIIKNDKIPNEFKNMDNPINKVKVNTDSSKSTEILNNKRYQGIRRTDLDFQNKKGKSTLPEHVKSHGKDFGINSEVEYLTKARNFLEKPVTSTTESFVSSEGTYFRYDKATNEFGIMNKYGGVSTYFKPYLENYWEIQIQNYGSNQ